MAIAVMPTLPKLMYSYFHEWLTQQRAILDGEIVCLDSEGRPEFDRLFYRRDAPYFYAFDVVSLDGRDLRGLPLVERKAILRGIVPKSDSRLFYLNHVQERGIELFDEVCRRDLSKGRDERNEILVLGLRWTPRRPRGAASHHRGVFFSGPARASLVSLSGNLQAEKYALHGRAERWSTLSRILA